jgi:hypothetical protein
MTALAKPSPNLDDARPIVCRPMGLLITNGCDTARDWTQVCTDASRPLQHTGGPLYRKSGSICDAGTILSSCFEIYCPWYHSRTGGYYSNWFDDAKLPSTSQSTSQTYLDEHKQEIYEITISSGYQPWTGVEMGGKGSETKTTELMVHLSFWRNQIVHRIISAYSSTFCGLISTLTFRPVDFDNFDNLLLYVPNVKKKF